MIRVLIVDDSAVARQLLTYIIGGDPSLQVIGTASDGEEAVVAVRERKPDVVVMDLIMPRMDGIEATRAIMETHPTPIVIVSSVWAQGEAEKTFCAMAAGALAALEKPVALAHPQYARLARELNQTVRLMAGVKVVRRTARTRPAAVPGWIEAAPAAPPSGDVTAASLGGRPRLVAIGASTGGPNAILTVLKGLPPGFGAPILIVQHIAKGFVGGFAGWLSVAAGLPVSVAQEGERPQPGHAYVAPDAQHMGLGFDGTVSLSSAPPDAGLRPSVSHLFRSLSTFASRGLVAVLLTGMGKDGAAELKVLRERGAVTIAQDRETSVVYGMPAEAVALGAASAVMSPAQIGAFLGGLRADGARPPLSVASPKAGG
jgi:two-component system chemotaxis response regulator CheB